MVDLNNDSVYQNMSKTKIYAGIDNAPKDGTINKNEAKQVSSSIFGKSEEEVINSALEGKTGNLDALKNIAKNLYNTVINSFEDFTYNAVEVEGDSVNSKQAEINEKVEREVNRQSTTLMEQFKVGLQNKSSEYTTPVTYTHADTTVDDKDKKGDNTKYNETSQSLKDNDFKVLTREVNGTKQEIFVGKENGEKVRYIIDDAGNKHKLVETSTAGKNKYTIEDDLKNAGYNVDENGKLGDDIKLKRRKVDGHYQTVVIDNRNKDGKPDSEVRIIGHDNNSGESVDVAAHKIETRGKDKFASDTSGILEEIYNNAGVSLQYKQNGATESTNDPFENASGTSNLSGKVRVKTGETTDVHGNNVSLTADSTKQKLDVDVRGQEQAIKWIADKVKDSATITGDFSKNEQVVVKFHDGATYTLNPIDANSKKSEQRQIAQSNDDTMVKIFNHYNNHKNNPITFNNNAQNVTVTDVQDNRSDANYLIDNGRGNNDTIGSEVTGYGSSQGNSGRVRGQNDKIGNTNVINYQTQTTQDGYKFTRSDFAKEGWKRSSGGTREAAILSAMQTSAENAIQNGNKDAKYVRNLQNANAFTQLYVDSYLAAKGITNVNVPKLENAIKVANPSFFDQSTGEMYRNADFNRINFPSDEAIKKYYLNP